MEPDPKLAKIAQVRDRLNTLVIRGLYPVTSADQREPDNAIGLARSILAGAGLDPIDFKLMPTIERSAEEMLAEFKVMTEKRDQGRTMPQSDLEARCRELETENRRLIEDGIKKDALLSKREAKIASLTGQLRSTTRHLAKLNRRTERTTVIDVIAPKPEAPIAAGKWDSVTKSPEAYQEACRLRIVEQLSSADTAARMGYVYDEGHKEAGKPRTGIIDGATGNRAPNEKLLGVTIEILKAGKPMEFYELWKVGHTLYTDKWRTELKDRYGLDKPVGCRPPTEFLTQTQMDQLRSEYWEVMKFRVRYDDR